jgi:hypothetical protein
VKIKVRVVHSTLSCEEKAEVRIVYFPSPQCERVRVRE